ncbi:MAG: hypothetical protein U0903_03285 [Planctomycetales bacterium]
MKRVVSVTLPEELLEFLRQNSGPNTPHASIDEFACHVLQEAKDRTEARSIRAAILEGYRDAIEGRTVEYHGNLNHLLRSWRKFEH